MSEAKRRCKKCSAEIVEAYEDPNDPEGLIGVCVNGHHELIPHERTVTKKITVEKYIAKITQLLREGGQLDANKAALEMVDFIGAQLQME